MSSGNDYTLEDDVHLLFTTRAFATGIPGTLSAATVAVYEDVTATPILTSVAVTEDLNSIAGLNAVTIAATAANGFNVGGAYHVVIEAGTVDSVSVVGEVVGNFTIGHSAAAVDLANGTDGLGAIKTETAAILTDTGTTIPATITTAQNDLDILTGSDGATLATAQANYAPATAAALAVVDGIVDSILLDTAEIGTAGAGLTDLGGMSTAMKAEVNAEADTAISDAALATASALATAQSDLDTITGSDGVTLATAQANYAPATAAALATVDGIVDSILVDTAEIGAAGAGLTAVPWNASWDAEVESEVTDALNVYDPPTKTELDSGFTEIKGATWSSGTDTLEAIRDRGDSAWTTGAGGTPPQLLQNTTIATLSSQTVFTLTAGSTDDDAYNGAVVVVTDQSTSTQKAVGSVLDYTGSTKEITLAADPGIYTMATGDTIDVIANASTAPTAAAVRAEIDSNSTQLAAIVADTGELQTDWANGGRLDLILDARASQTTADAIETDTQDLQTQIGTAGAGLTAVVWNASWDAEVQSEVTDALNAYDPPTKTELDSGFSALNDLDAAGIRTAVGLATANVDTQLAALPTAAENRAEIDSNSTQLAAIVADTNELQTDDVPTLIAALNDISVADVLTTQMTESYAANGTAPTLAQAQFAIHQMLMQFGIAGTSLTVRKLDDSTTAFVVTLDSASAPTDASRV